MEALLLGGDDDDDSDDDNGLEGLLAGSMPVAAAAPPANNDLSARLKSLYSPANNNIIKTSPPQPMQMQPQQIMQQQQPMQMQQQQQPMQQQQAMQQAQPLPLQRMQSQPMQRNTSQQMQRMPQQLQRATSQPMQQQRMPQQQQQQQQQQRQVSLGARQQQQQQQQRTSSSSSGVRPLVPNNNRDPFEPTPLTNFEPTPLTNMITPQQQQQQQPRMQQQQQQQPRMQQQQQQHHRPQQQQQQQHHHRPQQQQMQQQQPMMQPPNPQPMHRGTSSTSSGSSVATVRASNVNHHHRAPQQQQQPSNSGHRSSGHHSTSSANTTIQQPTHSSSNSHHRSSRDRAQLEREAKKAKEQFLMFTRVLMKYLEQKDPQMHGRAKAVIRECAEKNKKKEQGYESVTASMKTRLLATVGEQYWKRAESYLTHFQEVQRKKKQQQQPSSSSTQPSSSSSSSSMQQQQAAQQQQKAAQIAAQQKAAAAAAANKKKAEQQALIQKRMLQQQKEKERRAQHEMEQQQQKVKQQQQQKQQEELMRKKNADKVRQHQASVAKLQHIRESNAVQMAALKAQTNKQRSAAAAAGGTDTKPSVPKTQTKRKTSTSSVTPAAAHIPSPAPAAPAPELPPREYNELMEMVDHAVDYDVKSAALLIGSNNNKADLELNSEQRKLLYGTTPPKPSTDNRIRRGWSDRNIVTTRGAWAKVRLREAKAGTVSSRAAWFNEDRAESDPALAILSEATQMYLKQVLEKALQCARQRENLEGIRLWHLQHSKSSNSSPPIGIRLGCDVSRQIALAAGNTCRTIQRLEEALERNPASTAKVGDVSTSTATSMGELACRPKLAHAAKKADYNAQRCFELSGGKDSSSPPLGRAPKRAKIMAHDFQMGMQLLETNTKNPRELALHFL